MVQYGQYSFISAMLQTLFYIPPFFLGIPLFGFGWLLGILIFGTFLTLLVPKLRGKTGVLSLFCSFVVFAVLLVFVAPNLVEPEHGIPIRGYGFCLLLAIFSALLLVVYLGKEHAIKAETIYSLCLWAVVSGILGARIFYVTEYWQEMLRFDAAGNLLWGDSLFSLVNIANGGLTVYGSVIGGIVGSLIFIRRNELPMLPMLDIMAPAFMLGIAIGRIGCLLNGCCFGGVCDLPWAVTFPAGSPAHIHQIEHGAVFYWGLKFADAEPILSTQRLTIAEVQPGSEAEKSGIKPKMVFRTIAGIVHGKPMHWETNNVKDLISVLLFLQLVSPNEKVRFNIDSNSEGTNTDPYYAALAPSPVLPVHPAQIYSSITAFVICGMLLVLGRLQRYKNRTGLMFATFLIFYSTARFVLEIIRTDEDSFLGTGLTVSQNVSLVAGAAGLLLFAGLILSEKKENKGKP
ncbi:prolipoprotein diacylglyceryl transferase [Planctomycetales bacterium]|nr:prolipoprotein diacylglyceryl transferase [Planctomycetales bacterium]